MATFTFDNDTDSNLQSILDVNQDNLFVYWYVFNGEIGTNLTLDTSGAGDASGTGTIYDGEITVSGDAADNTYAFLYGAGGQSGVYII